MRTNRKKPGETPELQTEPQAQEKAERFSVRPTQQVTILCDNDLLFSGSGITGIMIEKQ